MQGAGAGAYLDSYNSIMQGELYNIYPQIYNAYTNAYGAYISYLNQSSCMPSGSPGSILPPP